MSGFRIVTDPFDASTGYPIGHTKADAVLVSHHHGDHDAVDTIEGYTAVIDTPGLHTLGKDIQVHSLESFHDDQHGALRGTNLIHCVRTEGLCIVHLGDLGHIPDTELRDQIGLPDILMIPIGGHYTVDAGTALQICDMLKPKIILPMHYKTAFNSDWPISGPEEFLELCVKHYGAQPEHLDVLRVTEGDLSCQPHVAVLRAQV